MAFTAFSRPAFAAFAALAITGCTMEGLGESERVVAPILTTEQAFDEFTYARPQEARVTHLALDLALDFEAEVAVIIGPVPMRATREIAAAAIRLVTILNDVSLRKLVVDDLLPALRELVGAALEEQHAEDVFLELGGVHLAAQDVGGFEEVAF